MVHCLPVAGIEAIQCSFYKHQSQGRIVTYGTLHHDSKSWVCVLLGPTYFGRYCFPGLWYICKWPSLAWRYNFLLWHYWGDALCFDISGSLVKGMYTHHSSETNSQQSFLHSQGHIYIHITSNKSLKWLSNLEVPQMVPIKQTCTSSWHNICLHWALLSRGTLSKYVSPSEAQT